MVDSHFHVQLTAVLDVLMKTAVSDICALAESWFQSLHKEIARSKKENEDLRQKLKSIEEQKQQRAAGPQLESKTVKEEKEDTGSEVRVTDDSCCTVFAGASTEDSSNPPKTAVTANTKRCLIFRSTPPSSVPLQQCFPAALESMSVKLSASHVSVLQGPVYLLTGPRPHSHGQVLAQRLLPVTSNPATAGSSQATLSMTPMTDVPYTTQRYRKRKMEKQKAGIYTRKYVRQTDIIACKKCKKERKPPAHHQYFGNWYCEETDTMSLADWKATLKTRGYGKTKDTK